MAAIQKSISNKSWRGCGEKGTLNGTPLQYSCLENLMDRGAWKAAVHGVTEGRTWLSDFAFTLHFHALEKEMATHSSVLAWRIPGTGEPGGLPSMGSHRVGHDWSVLALAKLLCGQETLHRRPNKFKLTSSLQEERLDERIWCLDSHKCICLSRIGFLGTDCF